MDDKQVQDVVDAVRETLTQRMQRTESVVERLERSHAQIGQDVRESSKRVEGLIDMLSEVTADADKRISGLEVDLRVTAGQLVFISRMMWTAVGAVVSVGVALVISLLKSPTPAVPPYPPASTRPADPRSHIDGAIDARHRYANKLDIPIRKVFGDEAE